MEFYGKSVYLSGEFYGILWNFMKLAWGDELDEC